MKNKHWEEWDGKIRSDFLHLILSQERITNPVDIITAGKIEIQVPVTISIICIKLQKEKLGETHSTVFQFSKQNS